MKSTKNRKLLNTFPSAATSQTLCVKNVRGKSGIVGVFSPN
jgi:hypothetical protein